MSQGIKGFLENPFIKEERVLCGRNSILFNWVSRAAASRHVVPYLLRPSFAPSPFIIIHLSIQPASQSRKGHPTKQYADYIDMCQSATAAAKASVIGPRPKQQGQGNITFLLQLYSLLLLLYIGCCSSYNVAMQSIVLILIGQ